MKVVCNSSVLIALDNANSLSILKDLYREVIIPLAVKQEVYGRKQPPPWIKCMELSQPLASKILGSNLETGESEAICLYEEIEADLLIIDDLEGRKVSERLGAMTTGTLGILILAKERGIIKNIKPVLKEIMKAGFRISEDLYNEALSMAKES